MKVKTSITISADALKAVDRIAGKDSSRSQVIERAVYEFVARRERARRDARDLAILNEHADELNEAMADALDYQAES